MRFIYLWVRVILMV